MNMLKLRRSWVTGYATALLMVLAATGLRLYVGKQAPLAPFIIAVMLSVWLGDLGPGILATILAAVANTWILSPQHSMRGLVETTLGLSFFLVVSVAITRLYEAHRKTDQAVNALKEGLQDRDRKLIISEESLQNETRILKGF
jgi:K+-sensing histidine kinase KdpD